MAYRRERDEFVAKASKEGLSLDVIQKLLRHATTLQRLAVAQCNGDWPFNGDRDKPYEVWSRWETVEERKRRWERRYAVCPKCETSGVCKSSMRYSDLCFDPRHESPCKANCAACKAERCERSKICPDCRTQELVFALLVDFVDFKPIFGGDPRGAVLRLSTPGFPYDEHRRNGANGLYVPARER